MAGVMYYCDCAVQVLRGSDLHMRNAVGGQHGVLPPKGQGGARRQRPQEFSPRQRGRSPRPHERVLPVGRDLLLHPVVLRELRSGGSGELAEGGHFFSDVVVCSAACMRESDAVLGDVASMLLVGVASNLK